MLDFAYGSGSLPLNVRKRMVPRGIGKIYGQGKNITTYNSPVSVLGIAFPETVEGVQLSAWSSLFRRKTATD